MVPGICEIEINTVLELVINLISPWGLQGKSADM